MLLPSSSRPATRSPRSPHGLRSWHARRRLPGALLATVLLWLVAGLAQAALPIQHWSTSRGARVYFVAAPTIPMLDVEVDFDAGARFDPPGREGLASMTNAMLGKGADGLDESAIDEGFANVGARDSSSAGDDRAMVSLRTLTSEPEMGTAVGLLARMIARPTFPDPVFQRERDRVVQAIRESDVRPETIAQRAFESRLYGSHPYGRMATADSVQALGVDELKAFYQANYGASRAVVSMIGAISRAQAEAIAEQLTAGLPAGSAAPPMPPVAMLTSGSEVRIEHPATQSHILIGAPAMARDDPDFFPLLVGNYVLGGSGFVSRLYGEVREKRGLAYSVYSYFSPQLQPGPFLIGLQTRKEQTDLALSVVRKTLADFLRDGPSKAELEAAKAGLIGGFPLRIDSNAKILANLANIGYYRLPLNYLDTWTEQVRSVTREQILAAFARKVSADRLVTVVVGAGNSTDTGARGGTDAAAPAAGARPLPSAPQSPR